MNLPESVLILAPHPDDDIIGAGGLLSLMSRNGKSCNVVYGTIDEPRAKEAVAALKSISENIIVTSLYSHVDRMLSQIPDYQIISDLEKVIEIFYNEEI